MRQIAVAVHSGHVPGLGEKARLFVEALAKRCPDAVLLVGGYWGHMVDVVDAALERGLRVVLFLPLEREEVKTPPGAVVVKTGCEFRCRSVLMIRSADVVAVLGGGVGTTIEALMAYAMGKPFFVLANVGAASDRLQTAYPEYFDERKAVKAVYEEDPVRLAELVCAAEKGAVTNFG
ncbi:MAG: LOG family protein [Pyrobaculum sp.]|nr:LOG family protein [Pyrobaculum sp.]